MWQGGSRSGHGSFPTPRSVRGHSSGGRDAVLHVLPATNRQPASVVADEPTMTGGTGCCTVVLAAGCARLHKAARYEGLAAWRLAALSGAGWGRR